MPGTRKNELNISVLLSYIGLFANVAGSLAVVPIVVNAFGTAEYGLYMLAYSVGMYVNVDGLGIGGLVVRQVKAHLTLREEANQRSFLFQALLVFALMALASFAALMLIGASAGAIFARSIDAGNIARFRWMLGLTALNCALMFFYNLIISVITGYDKLVFIKGVALFRILIRVALIIGLIGRLRVESLVVIDLAITAALIAFTLAYALAKLKVRLRPRFDKGVFRSVFQKTGFVFVSLVSDNVCWNSGSLIVAMHFGEASVGVFSIAMTLCGVFSQLSASISGLFLPGMTQLVVTHAPPAELLKKMISIGRSLMALMTLVIVGFGFVGREFLVMYLGEAFYHAYSIALPLMIALLYPSVQLVGDSVIQAMDRFNARSAIQLLSSLTAIALGWWLIPRLGLEGSWVGLAVSVVVFRVGVTNAYLMRLGLSMRVFFMQTVPRMALVLALLCPVVWLLFNAAQTAFIAKCLIISAAYVVLTWLCYFSRDERLKLARLAQRGRG